MVCVLTESEKMNEMLGILNIVSLVAGILWLILRRIWGEASVKDYFTATQTAVLASIVFSLLFDEYTPFAPYVSADASATLVYILTAGVVYIWLSLSQKWFSAENLQANLFCVLALSALAACQIVNIAGNLAVMFVGIGLLLTVNYLFLYLSQQTEELHNICSRYGLSALFFAVLACVSLYLLTPSGWGLKQLADTVSSLNVSELYMTVAGILFIFLFMLAIAPLHFWFADTIAPAVLPVAAYFSLVPQISLWTAFLKINYSFLYPVMDNIDGVYIIFGILSVFAGAIGANTSRHLRKIFACGGIYHLGVMLLVIASFTDQAVLIGLNYMQMYILAMTGIYVVFYAFKSRGDYLYNLNMVGGFAKVHPFVASALLFFTASLIGMAPLPGFGAMWAVLKEFTSAHHFALIAVMLGGLLLLLPAYLQVARSVCFAQKQENFDRMENNIYFYLFLLAALMLFLTIYPQFWDNRMPWIILAG